jgi:2-(1,2-epoxy-1,2-dihydrophenyl)acetyl-CoA isomerase
MQSFGDVSLAVTDYVATVEIHRPPNNFFDAELIAAIADAYDSAERHGARAIVLSSEGKNFCAGADFAGRSSSGRVDGADGARRLYDEANRLFEAPLPVVAAVQGAAVGGGLGLACSADFRVAGPQARFSANFARLGLHQGFGLSATLPRIVGQQHAWDLLYTGRRVEAQEAVSIGLADRLADEPREAARELAVQLAESAPLAVRAIRATMRAGLAAGVRSAMDHERSEQAKLWQTADFAEGVAATAERRTPRFTGR